jgi:hypothetical protein
MLSNNIYPVLEILLECNQEELDSAENEAIEIYNSVECGLNSYHTSRGNYTGLYGDKNGRSKYSNAQIEDVFFHLISEEFLNYQQISNITGVSRSMVVDIAGLHSHSWLKLKYPFEYVYLESLLGVRASKKYYTLISPEGEEISVVKLTDFCSKYKLDTGNTSRLLRGLKSSYKGWICKK